jgi:tRNA A-37 threonylcarbamoyl transferase component Bud32
MRLGPPLGPPLGEALRAALGSPAVIRRLSSSPRSRVWLVEFGRSPAIVKQITGGSEADAGARFAREVTALRLARRVRPAVVPDVLGTDPGGRVMVLEYLAEPARAPAPDWMIEYATALARLHSATGPGDADALPAWAGPGRADARAFISLAERLGVPVPASLAASLDSLVERLNATGHHALLHGDPCPDNAIRTDSGIMFVDLEQASLGDGRAELAYLRTGFPTCWCAASAPGPVLRQAEAAYRSAWRAHTGTDVSGDLAEACAGWLIWGDGLVERAHRGQADQLARLPEEDWRWGTASRRWPRSARTIPDGPTWPGSARPCATGCWRRGPVSESFRSPTTIRCASTDGARMIRSHGSTAGRPGWGRRGGCAGSSRRT